jgi:hypothetical protein
MASPKQLQRRVDPLPLVNAHWTPRRKAALIAAVSRGEITLEEASNRYRLTQEEFISWVAAIENYGEPGLRVTRTQIYRDFLPRSGPKNSDQRAADRRVSARQ